MSYPSERLEQLLGPRTDNNSSPLREVLSESGILLIDKPRGLTSMDVIRVLRKVAKAKKIGHGGTLDPFATGLLPILINQATKWSDQIMGGAKEYEGTFWLGQSYDTQDVTGKPDSELKKIPTDLDLDKVQSIAREFEGLIQQIPPHYSAVKKNGRPLYDYARSGESIEVESRQVRVDRFDILEWNGDREFKFFVRVQKGTYVRTLIHDLGQRLELGGVLESLRRTRVGDFQLEEAVQLPTLRFASDIREHLRTERPRIYQ